MNVQRCCRMWGRDSRSRLVRVTVVCCDGESRFHFQHHWQRMLTLRLDPRSAYTTTFGIQIILTGFHLMMLVGARSFDSAWRWHCRRHQHRHRHWHQPPPRRRRGRRRQSGGAPRKSRCNTWVQMLLICIQRCSKMHQAIKTRRSWDSSSIITNKIQKRCNKCWNFALEKLTLKPLRLKGIHYDRCSSSQERKQR